MVSPSSSVTTRKMRVVGRLARRPRPSGGCGRRAALRGGSVGDHGAEEFDCHVSALAPDLLLEIAGRAHPCFCACLARSMICRTMAIASACGTPGPSSASEAATFALNHASYAASSVGGRGSNMLAILPQTRTPASRIRAKAVVANSREREGDGPRTFPSRLVVAPIRRQAFRRYGC